VKSTSSPLADVTMTARPDVDDGIRRPDDDARVIPMLAVNSDSGAPIGQNDDGAGVVETDRDDSDSMAGVGRSGEDAGVEAPGLGQFG